MSSRFQLELIDACVHYIESLQRQLEIGGGTNSQAADEEEQEEEEEAEKENDEVAALLTSQTSLRVGLQLRPSAVQQQQQQEGQTTPCRYRTSLKKFGRSS